MVTVIGGFEEVPVAWLTLGNIIKAISSAMNVNFAAYPRAFPLLPLLTAKSAELAFFPIISQAYSAV